MATIKEAFDGMRQNKTANGTEYSVRYLVKGYALVSEFPQSFTWQGASNPFARLTGISGERQLGPDYYEITANYSTLPRDSQQRKADQEQPANPLLRAVRRSWSSGYLEVFRQEDLDGVKYCASNLQPFSGGLSIRIPYLIKKYVRNEAYFNESEAMGCLWHTNASKLTLCARYDGGEELIDNNVAFVEVSYEFWCLKPTAIVKWEDKVLDAGSFYLDADKKPVYLEDASGTKSYADGAILLDGTGKKLADDAPPVWLTFRNYDVTSFASLGLPGV
jgi:hypothetical protein